MAVIVGVIVGVSQSEKSSNASGATLYPTKVAPLTPTATDGGGIATTAPPAASTSAAIDGGSIATPPPTAPPATSTSPLTDVSGISLITHAIVTTRAVAVRS